MFDWIANIFNWADAPIVTSPIGGGAADNSKMPWYVTAGLVVIAGGIIFYTGKKLVDKVI